LAGVRAAAIAGLAITPLPLQTIKPGLRILDKKDKCRDFRRLSMFFS
jgi:hypothetical protein